MMGLEVTTDSLGEVGKTVDIEEKAVKCLED
jgi:hypothetical protein